MVDAPELKRPCRADTRRSSLTSSLAPCGRPLRLRDLDLSLCPYGLQHRMAFVFGKYLAAFSRLFASSIAVSVARGVTYPATLDDVNSGAHRGVRDVIAYGTALAEFELAKHESGRNVSVANAMEGFDWTRFPGRTAPLGRIWWLCFGEAQMASTISRLATFEICWR